MSSSDITSIQFRLQTLETVVAQQAQEIKDLKAAAAEPPQDWLPVEKFEELKQKAEEAKAAQETKAAQEAKEVKEAQEAKEANATSIAKRFNDLNTIDNLARQLQGTLIPDIRTALADVDKATVVSSRVKGLNLLECLSVFQGCDARLVSNKWWAMRVLLLNYPWSQAQIDAAMNKFLPLALTSMTVEALKGIVEFKHEATKQPLVTFDQVQKVVAAENLFGKMSAQHVKLMVSLMDQKKPVSM